MFHLNKQIRARESEFRTQLYRQEANGSIINYFNIYIYISTNSNSCNTLNETLCPQTFAETCYHGWFFNPLINRGQSVSCGCNYKAMVGILQTLPPPSSVLSTYKRLLTNLRFLMDNIILF